MVVVYKSCRLGKGNLVPGLSLLPLTNPMKYLLPAFICLAAAISGCKKPDPTKTDSYVHSKIDSLVGVRIIEENQHAMETLEQRMTIEVKAKADSIVAAHRAAEAKRDSAAAAQSAPAPSPMP